MSEENKKILERTKPFTSSIKNQENMRSQLMIHFKNLQGRKETTPKITVCFSGTIFNQPIIRMYTVHQNFYTMYLRVFRFSL
jgi:hypothetical protein